MLLTKKEMDSLDLLSLTDEQRQRIFNLKDELNMNNNNIYDYGVDISKKLGDFSTDLLNKVKVKDNPQIEELFNELMTNINSLDPESLTSKKPNFLKRLFKIDEVSNFIKKHDSIVPAVEAVKTKLEKCQYQLKKDIETCELFYQENSKNIEELDYHIIAARLKIKEEREKYKELSLKTDQEDILAVQELSQIESKIDLLERKVYNLELSRNLAIQNIPKLKILSDGDNATIDKISTTITMTIPVWESEMLLAVLISRAKFGSDLDKAVSDLTNKLIQGNSQFLRTTSTEIAKQIERGVIDVESLKKSSNDIIATCNEVKAIRSEAIKNRENAINELRIIQSNLASTILSIEQK